MKMTSIAAAVGALLLSAPVGAQDVEDYMLEIIRIEIEAEDYSDFREGMKAYLACYGEAGGDGTWSAWSNMDGEGLTLHVVSRIDAWAELDEQDEAAMSCWSTVEEEVAPHMDTVHTMYAKRLPAWSQKEPVGEASVVRLHNFRIDDRDKFRAAVETITGVMEVAEYEHMGNWYQVQGGGTEDPEYFVVEYFENFAAMDEDRAGPYQTMVEHSGEASAELVWEQFGDSLEAEEEYWSNLLRYDPELSHSGAGDAGDDEGEDDSEPGEEADAEPEEEEAHP